MLLGILVLFSIFVFFRAKYILKNATLLAFFFIIFIYSFSVRRYAWISFATSIVILGQTAYLLNLKKESLKKIISVTVLFGFYLATVFVKLPNESLFHMDWYLYCTYNTCSPLSAEFLKNKVKGKKLLTFYDWGGYLAWNYPQIKPSIDGRMFFWKDDNGYSPFVEYHNYDYNSKDINSSTYDMVYTHASRPLFMRLLELVKLGKWKMIYRDSRAGIFEREKD